MADAIRIGNAQISAPKSKTPPGSGPTASSGSSSGNSQVSANQAAAAKLGISIPGVGGGGIDAPSTKTPVPTLPGANPNETATPPATPQTPATDPNQTGQLSYEQAQKNLATGGLSGSTLESAKSSLATSYGKAHADLQASGTPAPANAGQALAQVYSAHETPADTTATDQLLSDDPGINTLLKGITQLLNPDAQSTSLLDDYKSLYKQSGLDQINKEIIDAETVINGTEGDIRNEIQGAGGLGTDSQIQAMSLARNKSLLTRYNQLVQMKTDATNQLNTMVSLDAQDKQMAQTKVNNQISAMFQMATFQQQADNNTREAFNNLQKNIGYQGLYSQYQSDPTQLSKIEKIMGMPQGGLASAASYEKTHPSIDDQYKLAEIANINSEINARNNPADKPPTQAQVVAQGYADRAAMASQTITRLGNQFASPLALGGTTIFGLGVPNALKSSDRQQYEQAQRDFVNAVLRPESGAAISDSEFSSASKQYFPQAGDSTSTVAQKAKDRQVKIQNLYAQSNTNQPVSSGDVIQYQGQNYHVDAQGNMIPL